jgi:hypothetical protein
MERLTLRTQPFAAGSRSCPRGGNFFAIDPRVLNTDFLVLRQSLG